VTALFPRPIAHRGLHGANVVENSLAAARAAVALNYAIECDVQLSADGDAVVFHDDDLERLTDATGPLSRFTAAALSHVELRGASETIPTLTRLLDAIGGRSQLVVELKSRFDGDVRLARRVAELVARCAGPVVIESFDPDPIAYLRENGRSLGIEGVALGIVAEAGYGERDWPQLSAAQRADMSSFLHYPRTRPDFLSFNFDDFPHVAPALFRHALNLPVTTWTVRTPQAAEAAGSWADAIVFEGFLP
jgi:glycerophosphoryl diester phosphodiesterase